MSLLQGYPSAALYNVRVSEIRVKVSARLRNTWLYYTKDTSENKTPSVTEMEDNEIKKNVIVRDGQHRWGYSPQCSQGIAAPLKGPACDIC